MDVSDKKQGLGKKISPEGTTALKVTLILVIMHTELTEGRRKYEGIWVCRESIRVLFTGSPVHHPPPPYHIQKNRQFLSRRVKS